METKIIVITAVVALCISVLMSAYFTRSHKQKMKKLAEEASRNFPGAKPKSAPTPEKPPQPLRNKPTDSSKSKKGGWASVMLPFYSLGILGYIIYVVGKIMSKKYSDARKSQKIKVSWKKERKHKGNTKTKITMHELQQLEKRLMETEEAVQQIFNQTCVAVKAAAKACESCSSDDDYYTKPMKRFKPVARPETESSEEEACPDAGSKFHKAIGDTAASGAYPQKRKIKRAKRRLRRNIQNPDSRASSSNSEPEHTLSTEHKVETGGQCICTSSEDELEKDENLIDSAVDAKSKEEKLDLLHTAKDIRNTMSQIQSYIDNKKTELQTGE